MKWFLPLTLLVSAASAVEYKIEKTNNVQCLRASRKGDTIIVHYEGYFEDGSKFDSSFDRNDPIKFPIGVGRVIQGWEKGLIDMCIGETRNLTIPSEMGYGSRGAGPVPPDANLFFRTELVGIEGVGEDEILRKDEL